MSRSLVDRIADAVLYEGHVLYPYRPSVKNRQRWTFGGLVPEAYCQAQGDAASNQTQCLVAGHAVSVLDVRVRFLHLTERVVGEISPPLQGWPTDAEPSVRPVEMLEIDGQVYHTWQEAEERAIELADVNLDAILKEPRQLIFSLPGRRWLEPLCNRDGTIGGVLVREQQALDGAIEVRAAAVTDGLFRVTVRVMNRTPLDNAGQSSRDAALLRSLISTHAILNVRDGTFVSLLDPPEAWREAAAECRNVGTWPVLAGADGERDTILASPIILYDYPQLAPESAGDLFDGTEIDEILTLRIMTLTDDEKRTAAGLDERTRGLMERTEALARDELARMHGTFRSPRPTAGETA